MAYYRRAYYRRVFNVPFHDLGSIARMMLFTSENLSVVIINGWNFVYSAGDDEQQRFLGAGIRREY